MPCTKQQHLIRALSETRDLTLQSHAVDRNASPRERLGHDAKVKNANSKNPDIYCKQSNWVMRSRNPSKKINRPAWCEAILSKRFELENARVALAKARIILDLCRYTSRETRVENSNGESAVPVRGGDTWCEHRG